jgi:hypothetical protein
MSEKRRIGFPVMNLNTRMDEKKKLKPKHWKPPSGLP